MSRQARERIVVVQQPSDYHSMSRRTPMYQDEYDDEDDYDDYGDEGSYEEEDDYGDERSDDYVDAPLPAVNEYNPDEEEHVKKEQLYQVQYREFYFPLTGSLDKLHRCKSLLVSKPSEALHHRLKQTTSMTNRSNPTEENTSGNLDRMIIVDAKQIHIANAYPRTWMYTVNNKLLVPNMLTPHGTECTNVIIAGTVPQDTKRSIFSPNAIMTAELLRKWERCDAEMVDEQFKFLPGQPTCLMLTKDINGRDSVAVDLLKRNPKAFPKFNLYEALRNQLPDMPYTPVPTDIGREMVAFMKKEVASIAERFVSAKDIAVRWAPADGQDLNSAATLVGESATLASNKQNEYKKIIQNTHYEAGVVLGVWYLPVQ